MTLKIIAHIISSILSYTGLMNEKKRIYYAETYYNRYLYTLGKGALGEMEQVTLIRQERQYFGRRTDNTAYAIRQIDVYKFELRNIVGQQISVKRLNDPDLLSPPTLNGIGVLGWCAVVNLNESSQPITQEQEKQ